MQSPLNSDDEAVPVTIGGAAPAYITDVEYAKRVSLPALIDELVSHVVSARHPEPLNAIAQWVALKQEGLAKCDSPLARQSPRGGGEECEEDVAPASLLVRLVEEALEEYLETGIAAVRKRVSEQSVRTGVERLLLAISAMRAVVSYEAEILFPMVDRECGHVATTHLLYQATDDLQKRLAETRVLLPALLENPAGCDVSPVYLADLEAFIKSYTLHATHKMAVVLPALASLTPQQQHYPLQLALAPSANDTAPLLTLVVTHLVEADRPYSELRGFIAVVRDASASPADYLKRHAHGIRKAAARSPLHVQLLVEDGLLPP